MTVSSNWHSGGGSVTRRFRLAACGIAIFTQASCGDSPTQPAPEPPPPETCTLAVLGSTPNAAVLPAAELEASLRDAAARLVNGMSESAATDALRAELASIPGALASNNELTSCQAFNAAVDALDRSGVENPPGSPGRADFVLIRQTLGILEVSLRG
ncbi:MAG TPA: hypothetical protein VFI91_01280 [Longimicrobiaceae bacterium]|nr:hypothetical protein [Longimicrobiaceae bacterium]